MFTNARKEVRQRLPEDLRMLLFLNEPENRISQMREFLVRFWNETVDVPEPMVRSMLADLLKQFGVGIEVRIEHGAESMYYIVDDRFDTQPAQCENCGHSNLQQDCRCCEDELTERFAFQESEI